MKIKNIIIWAIAAVTGLGLLGAFFMLSTNPEPSSIRTETPRASNRLSHETTEKEPNVPSVAGSKKENPHLRLDLELKGTMIGNDSAPLAVIFKIKEKKEILVKEGDTIYSAVVRKIMKEKVLLQVNDHWVTLLLKQQKTAFKKDGEGTVPGFSHTAAITWSDIDELSENLWDIAKQIKVFPSFAGGHLDGFRVFGVKEEQFFYKKLGLRSGDIVCGVNGKKINSLKAIPNIYDVFEQLESTGIMDIDIRRDQIDGKIRVLIE